MFAGRSKMSRDSATNRLLLLLPNNRTSQHWLKNITHNYLYMYNQTAHPEFEPIHPTSIPFRTAPGGSITTKAIILILLMVLTYIPTLFIQGLVTERESRLDSVITDFGTSWGQTQTITGPFVVAPKHLNTFPSSTTLDESSKPSEIDHVQQYQDAFHPAEMTRYSVETTVHERQKGLFYAPVYSTTLTAIGEVSIPDTLTAIEPVRISLQISDAKRLQSNSMVTIDTIAYPLISDLSTNQVFATIPASTLTNKTYPISLQVHLRGTRSITLNPSGQQSNVSFTSNWASPEFTGDQLPENYTITDNSSTANWSIRGYTAPLNSKPQRDTSIKINILPQQTDYQAIDRVVKYALLFIVLTFSLFFLFEVLTGLKIHPINYTLVGFALGVFYLLLVTGAELIGFIPAYLLGALATITLISTYMYTQLRTWLRTSILAGLLSGLYLYLLVLLQLEQYSLLFGSMLVFATLAIVMLSTRNINWYEL